MPTENSNKIISIITVTLNCVDTIHCTIESVLNQLTNQVEYIIIDGGSTDGTIDVIKKYSDRISYWSSEPDDGIYDAWNKGLAASSGKYICFVGADDNLSSDMVEKCLSHLATNDFDYISFKAVLNNAEKRVIGKPWIWNQFRRWMTVSHVGSLHNRALYTKYGTYNTNYKIAGDYEFLLRIGSNLNYSFIDYVGVNMEQVALAIPWLWLH